MSVSPLAPRDRLPIWVILLLLVFLLLRISELVSQSLPGNSGKSGRLSQNLTNPVDDQTMSALLTANWAAKTAFAESFSRPGQTVAYQRSLTVVYRKSLQEALRAAETLQKNTGNAPAAARRVIILRALLELPLLPNSKEKGLDPQQAFQASALAGLPPEDQSRYLAEGRLWAAVAQGPHLTPPQTDAYAAQLRALPNIRWWLYPALATLYRSQGNPAAADGYLRQAQTQALLTMTPLSVMMLLWSVLGLGGLALLILQGVRWWHNHRLRPGIPRLPGLWPTLPETVPLAERRLRAGDLMGVFVLYLLMPNLLGWLLAGIGIRHVFHFSGLLTPFQHQVSALPASRHVAAIVVLEFFAYLIGAAIPIGLLLGIARRRGASIGAELGWNRQRFGSNLLYGVGGYAVALPLVMLISLAGRHIPGPTPSNPAIPLLANASSLWVQALLVLLATVAAPLTEELLFRGVFYNAAKLRVGVWPAILLTGLIFGFVHPVGIGEMLPLAVLGGVFAWMAETRKSLVPSILGHCLQNSMATLMLLLALAG